MANHIVHVTTDGERWDRIAETYYGDPLRYSEIIAANPDVAITPSLDAGIHLRVPLLDGLDAPTLIDAADLPPWKR